MKPFRMYIGHVVPSRWHCGLCTQVKRYCETTCYVCETTLTCPVKPPRASMPSWRNMMGQLKSAHQTDPMHRNPQCIQDAPSRLDSHHQRQKGFDRQISIARRKQNNPWTRSKQQKTKLRRHLSDCQPWRKWHHHCSKSWRIEKKQSWQPWKQSDLAKSAWISWRLSALAPPSQQGQDQMARWKSDSTHRGANAKHRSKCSFRTLVKH